ncbi:MAG: hydrogenase maturation nickel metallochaperone HypA [Burkholderiales bacterium]
MHEMALAASMRDIVEEVARSNGASRVNAVRVEVGALACVEPEALRFCFDASMQGSLADGARLTIEITPGTAWCMPCGRTVSLARRGEPCPTCGSYQLQVSSGDEMRVLDIEVA